MSLLPPVGWADVATKQDLRVLENGIRAELHKEIGALRAGLHGDIESLRSAEGRSRRYSRSTWSAVTSASRPRVSSTRGEARTTSS